MDKTQLQAEYQKLLLELAKVSLQTTGCKKAQTATLELLHKRLNGLARAIAELTP